MASEKPASVWRPWWVDDLLHALMFLTRLPVPAPGAVGGGTLWLGAHAGVPLLAAALIALALTAFLTGALHEDGLADLADGFGGGGTKERKIEIMRDSRVGSYGVLALVIATGIKAACLANLAIAAPWLAAFGLMAAHVLGRTAILPIAYCLAPATATGLGSGAGRAKPVTTGLCLALGTLLSFALLPGTGFIAALAATALACSRLARPVSAGPDDTDPLASAPPCSGRSRKGHCLRAHGCTRTASGPGTSEADRGTASTIRSPRHHTPAPDGRDGGDAGKGRLGAG